VDSNSARTVVRPADVIDATRHDHCAAPDYARLSAAGLLTARDGLRWPLIERLPGTAECQSVRPETSEKITIAAGKKVSYKVALNLKKSL